MRCPGYRSLFLICVASLAAAGQTRGKRLVAVENSEVRRFELQRRPGVAILAGIDRYPRYSGLNELRYSGRDVDELEKQLSNQKYLVMSLKNGEATRGALLNLIRQLRDLEDVNQGTLIFFFSGHGYEDAGQNYIATYEATASDLAHTGLSLDELEAALNVSGFSRRVLWIDACRSEPSKAASGARTFARFKAAAGTRILFSTKTGQSSYEDDQLEDGVFSYFLLRGLRGGAAGQDGFITFRDLTDYIVDGVQAWGLEHGRLQVPYEAGESSGDFLLASTVKPARTPEAAVETPIPAGVPTSEPGSFQNKVDGLKYVRIRAGTFIMGCAASDAACTPYEAPPHSVSIGADFWLGQTEVTQEAFAKVMGRNPSHFLGDRLPAESVTWQEAATYCEKIGGRLPTEAEWEYAAKGPSAGEAPPDLGAAAWYGGNSGGRPHQVGSKAPNSRNLYDMLGNVWEWAADRYDPNYYSHSPANDPPGPVSGQSRVIRGGSWDYYDRRGFRPSNRNGENPAGRYANIGFRCVSGPN